MATAKNATKVAKKGIDSTDRWTSNGYGVKSGPISPERKAAVAKINEEMARKKSGKKK